MIRSRAVNQLINYLNLIFGHLGFIFIFFFCQCTTSFFSPLSQQQFGERENKLAQKHLDISLVFVLNF